MDRKEFLKRSLQLCAGCGAVATLAPVISIAEEAKKQPPGPDEHTFFDTDWQSGWIVDLMKTVDSELGEEERIALMKANGRACANRTSRSSLERFIGDLDGLLQNFRDQLYEGKVEPREDSVTVSWGTCYCPIVKDGPVVSDTYCYCTTGWFEEMFGMVLGHPVKADIHEAIKRGDKRCRVTVTY